MSNVIASTKPIHRSIGGLRPHEWQIRMVNWKDSGAVTGPHLFYGCPNGKGLCGVPIAPSPANRLGFVWQWDGNRELPTLTPSIHCTGGCGFHGFMSRGVLA